MTLPKVAKEACDKLKAPVDLVRHLEVVHEAAVMLSEGLQIPDVDWEQVLVGSAIHDLGKAAINGEINGPGQEHEKVGEAMLAKVGLEKKHARHARLHGHLRPKASRDLEACLVSLADLCWKGGRNGDLEMDICAEIARRNGTQVWQEFMKMDDLLVRIGKDAAKRLDRAAGIK